MIRGSLTNHAGVPNATHTHMKATRNTPTPTLPDRLLFFMSPLPMCSLAWESPISNETPARQLDAQDYSLLMKCYPTWQSHGTNKPHPGTLCYWLSERPKPNRTCKVSPRTTREYPTSRESVNMTNQVYVCMCVCIQDRLEQVTMEEKEFSPASPRPSADRTSLVVQWDVEWEKKAFILKECINKFLGGDSF